MASFAPADLRHMRHALMLAGRALGKAAPNPAVGCVVVAKEGFVAGRGWTGAGGRPHAETQALAQAGAAAKGAVAYVTLEPCAHHGKTPPCAEALIEARVARVVAAVADPDPRVNGKGFARLRDAGIDVATGLCEAEAAELNAGFFLTVREGRPLVSLKLAASLDGKIATASGESKWITGEEARRFGHLLRARHDAVLVGVETALIDDPALTCRLGGLEEFSPIRAVLDSRLRLPAWSRLAKTAGRTPTLVFCVAGDNPSLRTAGLEVVNTRRDARGRPDVVAVLKEMASRGITRLLVEGGASVNASFLERGVVDRMEVFRAPMALGGAGRDGIDALSALSLSEAPRFRLRCRRAFGADVLESYVREG
jgi:diaminohydroxyphosphoribosylaminopyrimidine deaminase / 5-amino-6-(5-phosphoribosylamino)uracil reductase